MIVNGGIQKETKRVFAIRFMCLSAMYMGFRKMTGKMLMGFV